jgi:hypothetical protein
MLPVRMMELHSYLIETDAFAFHDATFLYELLVQSLLTGVCYSCGSNSHLLRLEKI